jgi:hypothetical protein
VEGVEVDLKGIAGGNVMVKCQGDYEEMMKIKSRKDGDLVSNS